VNNRAPVTRLIGGIATVLAARAVARTVGVNPTAATITAAVSMAVADDPMIPDGLIKRTARVVALPGRMAEQLWESQGPGLIERVQEAPRAAADAFQQAKGTVIDAEFDTVPTEGTS
jgi:hypothetical protein